MCEFRSYLYSETVYWARLHRPESAGLICASVYILLLILFIPFLFSDFFTQQKSKENLEGLAASSLEFPHLQVWYNFTIWNHYISLTGVASCIPRCGPLLAHRYPSWVSRWPLWYPMAPQSPYTNPRINTPSYCLFCRGRQHSHRLAYPTATNIRDCYQLRCFQQSR